MDLYSKVFTCVHRGTMYGAMEGGIGIIDDLSSALPIELFTGRYKAELSAREAPSRGTPPPTCLVNCQLFSNYFSEWLHVLETSSSGGDWEHGGGEYDYTNIFVRSPGRESIFQLAVSQAFAISSAAEPAIRTSGSSFQFLPPAAISKYCTFVSLGN